MAYSLRDTVHHDPDSVVAGACSWDSSAPHTVVVRTGSRLGYKPQGDILPSVSLNLLKVPQSLKSSSTHWGCGCVFKHMHPGTFHIQTKTGLELKLPVLIRENVCLSGLSHATGAISQVMQNIRPAAPSQADDRPSHMGFYPKGASVVQPALPLLPLVPKVYEENFSMLSHFLLYLGGH